MEQVVEQNPLYPVFFKLDKLRMLVVGAGEVGYEKLFFILKSSPNANITIIAPWAKEEVSALIYDGKYNIKWIKKEFDSTDINGHDLIVAATNFEDVNKHVHNAAKQKDKLINVADTPELCDFYLGSIVTRGNLKVAISTNGKSPTFAKRFRQVLEEVLPDDSAQLVENLKVFRDKLKGDFEYKVKELNRITSSLVNNK
jgi:siroheme synthase-like protein